MGKAIVIVIAILLILATISFLSMMWGYTLHEKEIRKDGLPGLRGRALIQRAAKIMGHIGISPSIDEPELIRSTTRTEIDTWLEDYEKATLR